MGRQTRVVAVKDKLPRTASRMTAREVLVEAFLEPRDEHATHSVLAWGEMDGGGLQILCTCGGFATMPITAENKLALQNVPQLSTTQFEIEMMKVRRK